MRILKVEPGEAPYEKEMDNSLDAIQKEVGGGLFEPIYLDRDIVLCCNEEGKLNGMAMNRRLGQDIICGPFFLVGEDRHGNFRSLTDEEIATFSQRFAEPEQFQEHEPDAKPRWMIISM